MIITIILFGISAVETQAYKKSDLKKLLDTKKCHDCDLSGANLSGKDLEKADLSYANLTGANLTKTMLAEANMEGANLTDANLTGAILGTTYLEKANLTGANLTGANLYNAKLSEVIIDKKVASTHEDILGIYNGRQRAEKIKKQKESGEYDLLHFYANYQNLGKCFEARKGYAAVHVNANELKDVKSYASKIQNGIYKKYPALQADQDRIWKDSTKNSYERDVVAWAVAMSTPIMGGIQITNNFNDWHEICSFIKNDYISFIRKYGGTVEAPKKDF